MKNNLSKIKNRQCFHKGFTLIEIMVATSIFIIVMFIAVGSILSVVDANRRAQALSSVVSNLNIALESMIRDIRTGTKYEIDPSGENICFIDANGNLVGYQLSTSNLNPNRSIIKYSISGSPATCSGTRDEIGSITAPEVVIDDLTFIGKGIEPGLVVQSDDQQPLVILQIKGSVGSTKYLSPFRIETLISERVQDI